MAEIDEPDRIEAEERFLVLAPIGRDAPLTVHLLEKAGLRGLACPDMETLCQEARIGAAGLLLAEEALTPAARPLLEALLAEQAPWSDLPILLFADRRAFAGRHLTSTVLDSLGNVALLDRPLRPITMLSAARAALRARRRQYVARTELQRQEAAVRQRDQFLAMLGHELRNPLSTMMLATEMLIRTGQLEPYATLIQRQGRHLGRLVDDLLDVARATRGKVSLQLHVLDLGELIERLVTGIRSRLQQRSLELQAPTHGGSLWVKGDPVRLEQIFTNLLVNAIKYTPDGGHIRVGLSLEDEAVVVEVEDDGLGISAEMLPRVFDLFAQAAENLDRSQGGLGIGLTLVRAMVELHGGRIRAESAGPGQGSRFTVQLPRHAPDAGAAQEPGPGRPEDIDGSLRVLVIEDNADARELLRDLVRSFGHRVETASDGEQGVERALQGRPDVLLVDIGLPKLDGYEVARRLRPRLGPGVLFIAITGYGQPADTDRAREAGFDHHRTKPVDVEDLRRMLSNHPPAHLA